MDNIAGIALLIIIATIIISYQGFKNIVFFDRYAFEVDGILIKKEYSRLLASGFLHANWLHLIFNMAALYSFSYGVGAILGIKNFILLYFVSLIAGNLLALFIHRNHGDYSAIGASGAVSGVIFASIVMFPEAEVSIPFLPIHIQGWLFGIVYILISIYGIKTQVGNIGHEAHVGGAIAGIITAIVLEPQIFVIHPVVATALLLPFFIFMILLVKKPEMLMIDNYWGVEKRNKKVLKSYYAYCQSEDTLNSLLEKVSAKGINSLSKSERQKLDELSKQIQK